MRWQSYDFVVLGGILVCWGSIIHANQQNRQYIAEYYARMEAKMVETPAIATAIREVTGREPLSQRPSYLASFRWPWVPPGYYYLPCPLTGKMSCGAWPHTRAFNGILIGPGSYSGTHASTQKQVDEINVRIRKKMGWRPTLQFEIRGEKLVPIDNSI